MTTSATGKLPSQDAEWQLRCDLAAVFRVAARFDWCGAMGDDHISAALPGGQRFLANPSGLLFREITARALAVHELDDAALPVPLAVHARLHRARANAACALRVH